jgi:hypothetical protein
MCEFRRAVTWTGYPVRNLFRSFSDEVKTGKHDRHLQLPPEGKRHRSDQKEERDRMVPSKGFAEIEPRKDDKNA